MVGYRARFQRRSAGSSIRPISRASVPRWARRDGGPVANEPHSSDGTSRGNSACTTLEKELLVASGDIGHPEFDWLAAIGGKPFFVIRHCEDLTIPTDKNVNVGTGALNRPFGDEASNAGAKHFRPHAESSHFCFQGFGGKFEMVLHHRCIVFHIATTSNVVYREPFVLDDRIEARG